MRTVHVHFDSYFAANFVMHARIVKFAEAAVIANAVTPSCTLTAAQSRLPCFIGGKLVSGCLSMRAASLATATAAQARQLRQYRQPQP